MQDNQAELARYNQEVLQQNEENEVKQVFRFNVQLTSSQAQALLKFLPSSYSLQMCREGRSKKRPLKKKGSFPFKNQTTYFSDTQLKSELNPKVSDTYKRTQELAGMSHGIRQNQYTGSFEESTCLRILQLLKSHKTSWPFLQPVDPVTLNIPHYFEIIKQPMDLQTVQNNINSKAYTTTSQFHADINKIIKNSFIFNQNNPNFCKLTSQFEQYYKKISNNALIVNRNSSKDKNGSQNKNNDSLNSTSKNIQKKSGYPAVTLAEKKALASKIKQLPKEYLSEVAEIVRKSNPLISEQLNIEPLSPKTINSLQQYVKQKTTYLQINATRPLTNQNMQDQQQSSSFQSDSDS